MSDYNRSGSCACVVIIVGEDCYVANLGDSRAIMSENFGNCLSRLTMDHKPENEKERIYKNGGSIYQNLPTLPWRTFPGKLSVSRSFGDIEAKINLLGGNHKVLWSVPDVKKFKISKKTDFIFIGCKYYLIN
jgi:protein phosphatase 2C family protein 2/3